MHSHSDLCHGVRVHSTHCEVWKYCSSSSKVHAEVLQNLTVQQSLPCSAVEAGGAWSAWGRRLRFFVTVSVAGLQHGAVGCMVGQG